MAGQHMYYTIKEVKCLKEIKSDCIGGQLELGLDYYC